MAAAAAMLIVVTACAGSQRPAAPPAASGVRVAVRLAGGAPVRGALILLLHPSDYAAQVASPGPERVYTGELTAERDVTLAPGEARMLDVPPERGTLCAYLDTGRDFMRWFGVGPGSWYSSKCIAWPPAAGAAAELVLDKQRAARQAVLPAGATDHELALQGMRESMTTRLLVITPPGYEASMRRYPVLYTIHGLNGDRFSYVDRYAAFRRIMEATGQHMIIVSLEATGRYGHHHFANTPAHGPMQDALTRQIVPWVDAHYRTIAAAAARAVYGHSSGGWAATALLLRAPEVFGRAFASSPDPYRLRSWWLANPDNVYLRADGSPRAVIDTPTLRISVERFVQQELRSGSFGQVASFVALYTDHPIHDADLGADLPFDPATGRLRTAGWHGWEARDLYGLTSALPAPARSALAGRFHLYVSDDDDFGLYPPAAEYHQLLDRLAIPHTFRVYTHGGHGNYAQQDAFLSDLWSTASTELTPAR